MSAEDAWGDLDEVIEQLHRAVDQFVKGNYEPLGKLYSQRDDVTLGNPFGPFVRGSEQVVQTMKRAASFYKDGEVTGFDGVAKYLTADLVCLVEVESFKSKIGGREDLTPFSLRCTSIFRREDGVWTLVHRHADPITTPRSAESLFEA
jgi:ketosteroid isomerase-like protein